MTAVHPVAGPGTPADIGLPADPRKHPKGLYLLFTTEMWERMSYYGMRALLTLYMVDKTRGGLGLDDKTALQIYGIYTALVFLTPLAGGYLADRYLGQRRAVVIGGTMMMIGQFLLAMSGLPAFYAGLSMLILGNGMFKPNIATMVGGLYPKGDARRDSAFTIFYMGINSGALLAPLISGTLGETVGWHYGFAAAGLGMGLGIATFLLFNKRFLGNVGLRPGSPGRPEVARGRPLTREEWQRILVLFILVLFSVFFWAAFEQAGGLMNLYTKSKLNRYVFGWEIPATWFQAVNPLGIILLGPVFSSLWLGLARKGKDPAPPVKLGLGLILVGIGFLFLCGAARQSAAEGKAALMWMVATYVFHTFGELCLSPVGLSTANKLAPSHLASLLMGVWYLSNVMGNYLSGWIGGLAGQLGEFELFLSVAAGTMVAGALLLAISKPLHKMMHGADKIQAEPLIDPKSQAELPPKPKLA